MSAAETPTNLDLIRAASAAVQEFPAKIEATSLLQTPTIDGLLNEIKILISSNHQVLMRQMIVVENTRKETFYFPSFADAEKLSVYNPYAISYNTNFLLNQGKVLPEHRDPNLVSRVEVARIGSLVMMLLSTLSIGAWLWLGFIFINPLFSVVISLGSLIVYLMSRNMKSHETL